MVIKLIPIRCFQSSFSNNYESHIWNSLFSGLIIIAFFLIFDLTPINQIYHWCLMDYIFGIQCPGCGILRGFSYIFSGKIVESFYFNPLAFLLFGSIVIQVLFAWYCLINKNRIYLHHTITTATEKLFLFLFITLAFYRIITQTIENL
ncbi:MAG: DUF2752 domain-containing protein [Bacteroidia bacterium]|jgi:hypothetical protein